jgi:hypothetical protein
MQLKVEAMQDTDKQDRLAHRSFAKTEDRRQKTEDRRQKTEDRRQKTEDRRQKTECNKQ